MWRVVAAAAWAALGVGASGAFEGEKKPRPREPVKLTEAALALHRDALVFDGHNDLPWRCRELEDLAFSRIDLRKPQKEMHTDIPRLHAGGAGNPPDQACANIIELN